MNVYALQSPEENYMDFMEQEFAEILQDSAKGLIDLFKAMPHNMTHGVQYTWPCGCGGTVTGSRSAYNGHLHARCKTCDTAIME